MPEDKDKLTHHTEAVVKSERHIQEEVDHREEGGSAPPRGGKPMQAGQRDYPAHFPEQHLEKPGIEAELEVKPMYEAPEYKGSSKLQDMVALITSGDSGIGRAVAVLYAREGADIAIVYLNEHEDAEETKRAVQKEGRRCILIAGDVAHRGFCESAVKKTISEFGKLDILVSNAAFQEHVEDFLELTEEQV